MAVSSSLQDTGEEKLGTALDRCLFIAFFGSLLSGVRFQILFALLHAHAQFAFLYLMASGSSFPRAFAV